MSVRRERFRWSSDDAKTARDWPLDDRDEALRVRARRRAEGCWTSELESQFWDAYGNPDN